MVPRNVMVSAGLCEGYVLSLCSCPRFGNEYQTVMNNDSFADWSMCLF
jgi:hypothetical protein